MFTLIPNHESLPTDFLCVTFCAFQALSRTLDDLRVHGSKPYEKRNKQRKRRKWVWCVQQPCTLSRYLQPRCLWTNDFTCEILSTSLYAFFSRHWRLVESNEPLVGLLELARALRRWYTVRFYVPRHIKFGEASHIDFSTRVTLIDSFAERYIFVQNITTV